MDRAGRLTFAALRTSVVAALMAASPPAPAGTISEAGAWDLALDGSHRKCRIMLSDEPAGVGRAIRFPVGCRRALPILNTAAAWLSDKGVVRVLDAEGRAILEFKPGPEEGLLKAQAGNEAYRLERQERAAVPAALPEPPRSAPQPTPIDPVKAPAPDTVPGLYAVDRYTDHDVCRLVLSAAPAPAADRFEARILEGCRDAGLLVFDPVAWRYEAGRLTITARRGHGVTLISDSGDRWRRDPDVGSTLTLRKVTP